MLLEQNEENADISIKIIIIKKAIVTEVYFPTIDKYFLAKIMLRSWDRVIYPLGA